MLNRSKINWILACGLALVFAYAGFIKLVNPDELLDAIANYRLVGRAFAWFAALILPPLELVCALGLCLKSWRRASASILALLMLVFIAALFSALFRGLDISCGCFGASDEPVSYPLTILRDLALFAAACWLAVDDDSKSVSRGTILK